MADAGEMRQNAITGQWVICAPGRGARPRDLRHEPGPVVDLPAYSPGCPFCPGNERLLSTVTLELPGEGGWQARSVHNKYPVIAGFGRDCTERGPYATLCANGVHEVIVESPRHNADLPDLPPDAMRTVVEAYRLRYAALAAQPGVEVVMLLRNHGAASGASLAHPHAQIMAIDAVPPHIAQREAWAGAYLERRGRCGFCDLLDWELRDGRRIVAENEAFVTFVPFAAEAPFDLWVMPRDHLAHFHAMSDAQADALARALQDALTRLRDRAGDPAYNLVVQTASLAAPGASGDRSRHWYLQVRPRIGVEAGFELATGIAIVPSLPEHDAAILRG